MVLMLWKDLFQWHHGAKMPQHQLSRGDGLVPSHDDEMGAMMSGWVALIDHLAVATRRRRSQSMVVVHWCLKGGYKINIHSKKSQKMQEEWCQRLWPAKSVLRHLEQTQTEE